MATSTQIIFRRHIALTNEHGSWALLLSPLLIGLFAGGQLTTASIYLILAAVVGFLIRHPIAILVKIYSGRRDRRDLPAAAFWIGVYAIVELLTVLGLVSTGFGYLLVLAVPGIAIFTWHLILVSRRTERRQMGVEIVASGVLALTAPAAMWVGLGEAVRIGWLLWVLVWIQSAASIIYAYLRLEQRGLKSSPELRRKLGLGSKAIIATSLNLVAVGTLSQAGVLPDLLYLPYALQWGETLWGSLNPAIGLRPASIGIRQLVVTGLFTLLFILAW
jgi:YwiC-like protein